MQIEELRKIFEQIPASIGGYAVLYDKNSEKYYFIQHPVEMIWLVNNDMWYNYSNKEFNKFELLSYR